MAQDDSSSTPSFWLVIEIAAVVCIVAAVIFGIRKRRAVATTTKQIKADPAVVDGVIYDTLGTPVQAYDEIELGPPKKPLNPSEAAI
ncbi:hypothetical protein LEN26_008575 [Aphanomyces euteiches]|uniref:Uncharacterized protein n=1 Tax=Aphanomyces euteiches TaxID=100861 RepID=A0A6G0X9K3_9STRA|nr:hypothetical protein Ae201684_006927 [Aphanomyces euteiches]KAH9087229.1 hypothetical protein Ae201684P_000640 [Aphanomyces euteiches]KAH9125809.1 hypothetical protein AeMF1_003636 [Aphanomyces euteiches]KAH9130387.1 hypothetical protein LEN26_008575 [Aphanomyces euteiches]KAH9153768.1 hypothetical protein AeRB84_004033 [Aphanomyces euteiches]